MKVPLSWLKDYVDIDDIPLEKLTHTMTMAGLEIEEIHFVGLQPPPGDRHDFKVTGLAWDREKFVVGEVLEINPHPDADRLVLCELNDGEKVHTVLTGAPNLLEFKDKGRLKTPLKMAYAKQGAVLYDGHKPGWVLTKLKKTKIRGVESYSMICSEKELGISEEHEGVIILPEDAPAGMPLADYMGDAVLDIAITPNVARNANVLGVAREVAALFELKLKQPDYSFLAEGDAIAGQAMIDIQEPELNPRFVLGLIKDVTVKPSPDKIRRRLTLIGQRPINNIVDATNYVMFDIGQPLHAFDYDVLVKRAGGKTPTIITRTAKQGEKITTLDGVEHTLESHTVLVCDVKGAHSIAGIMGGAETEVCEKTKNVLLEGANWNFINIRKSLGSLRMYSEASYRFSRDMHPAMAPRGVAAGLELMQQWSGGVVSEGLIDEYPITMEDPIVEITEAAVKRWLGVDLKAKQIAALLKRLEFEVTVKGKTVSAKVPDHRMDINAEPVIGMADLMEEVARIYGYENIPETRMSDRLPPQRNNPDLDFEENLRDILVNVGLQEIITYRLTSPEREARRLPPEIEPDKMPYVELVNPIAEDRYVMRKSLMSSVLEIVERNTHIRERIAMFEIGYIYLSSEDGSLPDETPRLVISLTGPRTVADWMGGDKTPMDFYDLKGVADKMLAGLQIKLAVYENFQHPVFHPGKCARITSQGPQIGVLGELHPAVHAQYDFSEAPVLAATFNIEALQAASTVNHEIVPVSIYPPVLEDLALVVEETISAEEVQKLIDQTGGKTVTDVRLFDVYRGEQLGTNKKSLAYSITYQAEDRTLTDKEVAKVRNKIIKRLEKEISAKLRD
ncbi:MAG: phenylalanine--tRNA ligase subunit beta [Chloroflexota bacterium]